jgi:flagellar P-ring protein precursor FlgI
MRYLSLLVLFVFSLSLGRPGYAARVKDVTLVQGGRDNQLVGYGLVVGLANRGDNKSEPARTAVDNMLRRFGLEIQANIKFDTVAAVMVTADIPAFARAGTRIDVTVAAVGEAKTIQGGVLLQTPLLGADDTVYAVAQGPIAVGGFLEGAAGPGGATVQKNHPTVGVISGGALVEREIPATVVRDNTIELLMLNPDYASAARLAQAINQEFPQSALAKNPGSVDVAVPDDFKGYEVNFIARLGAIEVEPDVPARIVINERTGTIVATSTVRISTVALSHGSVTINIAKTPAVSRANPFAGAGGQRRPGPGPNPLANLTPEQIAAMTPEQLAAIAGRQGPPGDTPNDQLADQLRQGIAAVGDAIVTNTTQVDVKEERAKMGILEDNPTIHQVASALNALGLTTRDMMAIFMSMKKAGALQAELIMN